MSTVSRTGLQALLTPDESVLLLIDHQPFQSPTSIATSRR
jgi:hypothetical protein